MKKRDKKRKRLIGKVDVMMAAVGPGLVITEELAEWVVETLSELREEITERDHGPVQRNNQSDKD